VDRKIVEFARDEAGDWAATLDCFHRQHIRHNPPFRVAPWILDEAERARRVGSTLDCPLCDRAELPDDLEVVRRSDTWNERTMPAGLKRAHRVAAGRWGRLRVEAGELRFLARTSPPIDSIIRAGGAQAIPPEVEHEVECVDAVSFFVEFLRPVAHDG
jgi:tellurite resistance-related uncharacterized protein